MCCIMGYTGHDLPAAAFRDYLLRTVSRGPDDQRVIEGPFGLMGFGRLAIMGLTDGLWAAGHHGADTGWDAALHPRGGLRGLQRGAVRLPL